MQYEPDDAFLAGLDACGNVTAQGLENPALKPVIVVEFYHDDDFWRGIRHDDLDLWEVFEEEEPKGVYGPDTELYEICDKVALAYKDKLLDGPLGSNLARRLQKKMATEMLAEIDREILEDLRMNSGLPAMVSPAPVLPEIQLNLTEPPPYRKLKANWTVDAQPILRQAYQPCPGFVIKSRYINE